MTFFCPTCWHEIEESATKCPHCGADITESEKMNFEEKLLNALGHKEPETVEMVVWVLGELKSEKATQPLNALLKRTESFHLKCAILDALSKIGTHEAISAILETCGREIGMVRNKAREQIERIEREKK